MLGVHIDGGVLAKRDRPTGRSPQCDSAQWARPGWEGAGEPAL